MNITDTHKIADVAIKGAWTLDEVKFAFLVIARNALRTHSDKMLDNLVDKHNEIRGKIGYRK